MSQNKPDQKLIDNLYESVLKIRMVEDALAEIYHLREIRNPTHFCLGQEAIPVGVCLDLDKSDLVFGTYRSHGWYLGKGGNLNRMMGELFGKATGCSKGYGGSMHLIDLEAGFTGTTAIVSAAIPHAVGAALTFKQRKTHHVAISAFGDAATEEGVFTESVMFAALRRLPVVFICENNLFAVNTSIEHRQPPVPIHERVAGLGIPTTIVDGNDAVAVYNAAKIAIMRAREGLGPSFIECTTYRYVEHCGPNPDLHLGIGNRSEEDLRSWKSRDPVLFLERQVDSKLAASLKEKFHIEIQNSIQEARQAPFPTRLIPEGAACL